MNNDKHLTPIIQLYVLCLTFNVEKYNSYEPFLSSSPFQWYVFYLHL